LNGSRTVVPRPEGCTDAKRITQRIPEGMPVGHRKAQMFCHRPVLDHFGGVVVLESEGVFGCRPFVSNFADFRKWGGHRIVQKVALNRDEFYSDAASQTGEM